MDAGGSAQTCVGKPAELSNLAAGNHEARRRFTATLTRCPDGKTMANSAFRQFSGMAVRWWPAQ